MNWRRVKEAWPAMVPILCAATMMCAALSVHRTFSERPNGVCCGAKDVAIAKPASVPSRDNLAPHLYAKRANFVAAAEFQIVAIAAAIGFSLIVLVPLVRRDERRLRLAIVAIALAFGVTAALIVIGPDTSPTLTELVTNTIQNEFPPIDDVRFPLEQATSIAATILIAAASLLLLPPSSGVLEKKIGETVEHHSRLSYLLALGTALLAGDILVKLCVGRWAMAYYPDDKGIEQLVNGIVSGWAVYDSLFLAVTYIPAAAILRLRLKKYATDVPLDSPPAWFDRQWLSISPLQDLPRILAILAPFLVGQAPEIAGLFP